MLRLSKKFVSVLLTITIVFTVFSVAAVSASAAAPKCAPVISGIVENSRSPQAASSGTSAITARSASIFDSIDTSNINLPPVLLYILIPFIFIYLCFGVIGDIISGNGVFGD